MFEFCHTFSQFISWTSGSHSSGYEEFSVAFQRTLQLYIIWLFNLVCRLENYSFLDATTCIPVYHNWYSGGTCWLFLQVIKPYPEDADSSKLGCTPHLLNGHNVSETGYISLRLGVRRHLFGWVHHRKRSLPLDPNYVSQLSQVSRSLPSISPEDRNRSTFWNVVLLYVEYEVMN
jgi:hypothetical protein